MTRPKQSLLSDILNRVSRTSDERPALNKALREARLKRGLSQQELARKLGFRQRQISDLERAAMDPRLSTVQDVARALDLELTLIPRQLISVVEGLQRAGTSSPTEPMYTLDDDDDDDHHHDDAGVTRLGFRDGEHDRAAATKAELRREPRPRLATKNRSPKAQP